MLKVPVSLSQQQPLLIFSLWLTLDSYLMKGPSNVKTQPQRTPTSAHRKSQGPSRDDKLQGLQDMSMIYLLP